MPTATHRFTVAFAGLEPLPATRLKVASALLLADLLDIRLVPWTGAQVDLLVADGGAPEGVQAIRAAWAARLPVLTFSREASGRQGESELRPDASVRRIAEALKAGLAAGHAGQPGVNLRSLRLIDCLRLDRRDPGARRLLMELGLFRVVVDPARGQLHMLRRMPLDELLDHVEDPRWQSTVLDEADWQRLYRDDVTTSHAIAPLWWRLAVRPTLALPVLPPARLQLAAWPTLDLANTPPDWLAVLARLRDEDYTLAELVIQTGVAPHTVRRVMSVVQLSGLALIDAQQEPATRARRGNVEARQPRALLRLVRRLGRRLLGRGQA
ncbi:hypothetical protein [Pseudoxanthomonas winnipegensis]|uniref:Uncharacterized protein n=1 Tax=Pseudoxanthomonas winnipegensis TaxID=2480810 RepID=A0A4Q8L9L4_9GAMM|nr:hypothetical protein [Pseudoxanthomonas winnipegensis]RZZ82322.1 hypothetical protein EA662_16465 [Pseudoxanthomonas winnipegensis]TAA25247.1 hypothetical protein EA661_17350 [Pseudoxanthomonas winnipegensis]TAA39505.1 hypothetical protein EAT51_14970 [Pseudoxanthomonas winnipegensis]TBV74289.1 hypothetical protein EYC46_12710 [Pseudoxanthomonas winnipegensis]